jgi:hypothetical protein
MIGCLFLCCLAVIAPAQQIAALASHENSLPNAPSAMLAQQALSLEQSGTGSISGTVLDINEGIVPNARVTLVEEGHFGERTTDSSPEGVFLFSNVGSGTFRITITSRGLETFVSPPINLRAGEHHRLPHIALPLATASISVQVTITQAQIAQEQVTVLEKQRVLGILPNFYTSYIWDAAPLNTRQKFGLGIHSITDPAVFVATAVAAGAEQAANTFPGYGQGVKGYAKRYGADYADEFSSRMFSSAIYPSIFRQDPRYFYKGSGSKWSRFVYAISRAIITRGDNGREQPNYSRILGGFTAGAISNTYHTGQDRGGNLILRNGIIAIGGHAADNLLREFVLKSLSPHSDSSGNGQPARSVHTVKP